MPAATADRAAKTFALLAVLGVGIGAQQPTAPVLRAVCATELAGDAAGGLAWLVGTCLRQRPDWPAALGRGQNLAVHLDADGLRLGVSATPLPAGAALAGSVTFGDGQEALWECAADGTEDWYLPLSVTVPAPWQELLRRLQADVTQTPRTLDLGVLIGHLTTGAPDGDPRANLLHLGAAACGDVTWTAWRTQTHLRVRGRSAGGLLLPTVLVQLAAAGAAAPIDQLPLRAYTARDGDREEATRQLVRAPAHTADEALRALLHGDDLQRLVAIDALVRRGDTTALPRIVAAATADGPLASLAACDAVRSLFERATPLDRQRTRAAIARSDDRNLRSIDVDGLLPGSRRRVVADDGSQRARFLVLLCLAGLALYGLWTRERCRAIEAAQF
ncbi:MAG: hypothetical protein H6838_11085 [Planctomycetes bacterium]|nr:hypothetical protein [Planctomycetota bacterium]MCB9886031.1 hypothetical protein [Planctomycetota bacterium]